MKILSKVIEKLCSMTQSGELKWVSYHEYVKSHNNKALIKHNAKHNMLYHIYVAEVNGGVFMLQAMECPEKSPELVLLAQRTPNNRIVELNVIQEYQEELQTLFNLIGDEVLGFVLELLDDEAAEKQGEWVVTLTEHGWNCAEYPVKCKCSLCEHEIKYADRNNYCPNCGVRIDM